MKQDEKIVELITDITGMWFHGWDINSWTSEQYKGWQGQIIGNLGSGRYLVQLYSWLDGSKSSKCIVNVHQMEEEKWTFYKNNKEDLEWMQECWEDHLRIRNKK